MTHWAFCESLTSDSAIVEESEAHHLLHVLRLGVGDSIILFDGKGTEAESAIVAVSRRDVTCRIVSRTLHSLREHGTLTAYVAPPKADRLKWLVEKLTEVGVDRLVLLNTQRTVVTPGETRVDKLKANVIAACKQCRRPWLMEILPLTTFPSAVHELTSSSDRISFIAHPGAGQSSETEIPPKAAEISLMIGPEGGFTDSEVTLAISSGILPISWPRTILRIETAAIVFSSLLLQPRSWSQNQLLQSDLP